MSSGVVFFSFGAKPQPIQRLIAISESHEEAPGAGAIVAFDEDLGGAFGEVDEGDVLIEMDSPFTDVAPDLFTVEPDDGVVAGGEAHLNVLLNRTGQFAGSVGG